MYINSDLAGQSSFKKLILKIQTVTGEKFRKSYHSVRIEMLVLQFIVENVLLTLLGGVIAILFSITILQVINSKHLLQNTELSINLTVVFYAIIACLVFGFFSGVYPAWRMSKLNAVDALKQN